METALYLIAAAVLLLLIVLTAGVRRRGEPGEEKRFFCACLFNVLSSFFRHNVIVVRTSPVDLNFRGTLSQSG